MVNVSQDHLALYGNVAIPRAFCEDCQSFAFVIGGEFQCCGKEYPLAPNHYRRISQPEYKRSKPSATDQKTILEAQDYRCFYCEQRFDSRVFLKGKYRKLKLEWDHMIPYIWQANNKTFNFVAACQPCNKWKSSKIFATVEEAQVYLHGRWERERKKEKAVSEDVSIVRYGVSD